MAATLCEEIRLGIMPGVAEGGRAMAITGWDMLDGVSLLDPAHFIQSGSAPSISFPE